MREGVRSDAGDVPEEVEIRDTLKTGQAGESLVGERTVDQETRAASVLLQQREVVQQREAPIRDEFARAEAAEVGLALQGCDGAISGRRTHQVDTFEPVASLQMSDACIG